MVRRLTRPSDINTEGYCAPWPAADITWQTIEITYPEMATIADPDEIRPTRVFLLDGDLWVQDNLSIGHAQWWHIDIQNEYDAHHHDLIPPGLYLRVTPSEGLVLTNPGLRQASPELIRQLGHLLAKLKVPSDETVKWSLNAITAFDSPVQEYYNAIQ